MQHEQRANQGRLVVSLRRATTSSPLHGPCTDLRVRPSRSHVGGVAQTTTRGQTRRTARRRTRFGTLAEKGRATVAYDGAQTKGSRDGSLADDNGRSRLRAGPASHVGAVLLRYVSAYAYARRVPHARTYTC
ncbi:hypothetical protein MRX96_003375 [Rhipicephalus microplus]